MSCGWHCETPHGGMYPMISSSVSLCEQPLCCSQWLADFCIFIPCNICSYRSIRFVNQIHKWWGVCFSLQLGWFTSGITNRRTGNWEIIPFCWNLGAELGNRDGRKQKEWERRGEDQSTKKRQGDVEMRHWNKRSDYSTQESLGKRLCIKKDVFLSRKGKRWWKRG